MKRVNRWSAMLLSAVMLLSAALPAAAETQETQDPYQPVAAEDGTWSVDLGVTSLETIRADGTVDLRQFSSPESLAAVSANGNYREQLSARGKSFFDAIRSMSVATIHTAPVKDNLSWITTTNVPGVVGATFPVHLVRPNELDFTDGAKRDLEALDKDFLSAYTVLGIDCPDIFWMRRISHGYTFELDLKAMVMRIVGMDIGFARNFSGNMVDMYGMTAENAQLLADGAKAYSGGKVEQIKFVHDVLAHINTYNDEEYEKNSGLEYAYSAYSALIPNDKHMPVCEGYAKGMKMVLDLLGIPCVLSISSDHMWNSIKMDDGKWYNLDLTWDDGNDKPGDYGYFLVGNDTVVDGRKFTDPASHKEMDIASLTGANGLGIRFDMPPKNPAAYSVGTLSYDSKVEDFGEKTMDAPFLDVSRSAWYYDAVGYVREAELFNGTGEAAFAPNIPMNRAMFVQVLANHVSNYSRYTGPQIFGDVPADSWFYDVVNWSSANGLVEGTGKNQFTPAAAITREQMAVMLYKYAQKTGTDVKVTGTKHTAFTDFGTVSDWAKEAVIWAVDRGIINGMTATTIGPKATANRAQVAQTFKNADAVLENVLG